MANNEFERVSFDEVARALRAEPLHFNLEEITKQEIAGKKFLGTSYGVGVSHCAIMGARYYEGDFSRDARWYHIDRNGDENLKQIKAVQPGSIKVDFYGENK